MARPKPPVSPLPAEKGQSLPEQHLPYETPMREHAGPAKKLSMPGKPIAYRNTAGTGATKSKHPKPPASGKTIGRP